MSVRATITVTLRRSIILVVLALRFGLATANAQQVIAPSGPPIRLDVGKGTLIELNRSADTVFVADPNVADVRVKAPRLVYLFGKAPGDTSLYAVDADQRVMLSRPVEVQRDIGQIQAALSQLIPGGSVRVRAVNTSLVLSGSVDSSVEAEEVLRLARPFVDSDKQIIDRVTVDAPNQVNLRVRVAEVQHNVVKELGINWDALTFPGSFAFGIATGLPVINSLLPTHPPLGATNFLTRNAGVAGTTTDSGVLGLNTARANINGIIDALNQNGLVHILAEPNLTAMSGQTASFLAGGEFPILVPSGPQQVTVQFKQYGVRLSFTPVVLANGRISLRVRPEVSALSAAGAVQFQGYTIPALTTRRAETTVELGSGQTFAIGGLLQNDITNTINKVPALGDLPVLGPLFRSTQFQQNESELIILVTPYLVRPVSDARLQTPLDGYREPTDRDLFLHGRDSRPAAPAATEPLGANGVGMIGPAGFVLN